MSDKDENLDIKVSEGADGSATVDLPDDIENPQAEEQEQHEEVEAAEGGAVDDDADQPDDTEAIRAARRARRRAKKEYIKQANVEKDIRLQNLLRQNQELQERLAVVERKTHSSELARIDKAIEDQELRLQYARMKLSEATGAGDGEAMAKAQEMWYETRRQVEALKTLKTQANQSTQDRPIQQDNSEMQRQASRWMDRNPWYDPSGGDEDSEIAKVIDQKLVKEGWNPNTSEYWEELDNRLLKRLPHRYNVNHDERSSRKPRSIVTGSGRENIASSGSKNSFTLSPEQVRAMKDAGFWDDPSKRARMIKRYATESKQSQGYRS